MKQLLMLSFAVAVATLAAFASGGPERLVYSAATKVRGELRATGPDSMEPLMKQWIAAFQERQPGVRIIFTVREEGARDRVALGPVSVEVFAGTHDPFFRKYHYAPFRVMVSLATFDVPLHVQALGIFVNGKNPLAHLSFTQLERIYSAADRSDSREITTWGQLGLTGEWAARPVHAYSRSLDNEVTTHVREFVCRGAEFSAAVTVPGRGVSVDVVGAVAADPDGIGFAGLAYRTAGVKALALAETDSGPFIEPTRESCAGNRYPLNHPIYFYLNRPPGTPLDPVAKEFLRFVLSDQGQALVAEKDYFPLTPPLAREQCAKLD